MYVLQTLTGKYYRIKTVDVGLIGLFLQKKPVNNETIRFVLVMPELNEPNEYSAVLFEGIIREANVKYFKEVISLSPNSRHYLNAVYISHSNFERFELRTYKMNNI